MFTNIRNKAKRRKRGLPRTKRKMSFLVAKLKRAALIVLSFLILAGFVYGLLNWNYLRVQNVHVLGAQSFVSAADVENIVSGQVKDKNILIVNNAEIEVSLSKLFKGAKSVNVRKKLPATLIVEVNERTPLALITNTESDNFFMIDEDGYVLGVVDENNTNLPEIKYEGEIKVGGFISENLVPVYLQLVNALDAQPIQMSSMSFYPNYVQLYSRDNVELLIGNSRDQNESLQVANQIIRQMESGDEKVKKIDLRYDKVIVSFH